MITRLPGSSRTIRSLLVSLPVATITTPLYARDNPDDRNRLEWPWKVRRVRVIGSKDIRRLVLSSRHETFVAKALIPSPRQTLEY